MHSVRAIIEYSLLQKLVQVSVQQVLHHDRQWLPLPNDAEHLCYVCVSDAALLFNRVVKCSSAQTAIAYKGSTTARMADRSCSLKLRNK